MRELMLGFTSSALLAFTLALPEGSVWAQASSSLHSFSISDIGRPKPWRPGRVTVGEEIDDVVITALDEAGNKVEDFNGLVFLKQETDYGPGRVEPDTIELQNGEWVGDIRVFRRGLRRAKSGEIGDVWVEVTDGAPQPHVGVSNLFAALPEPFSRLLMLLPGEEHAPGSLSGKQGEPLVPERGSEFTVQVISTDVYWNILHSVTDVIRLSSSNPTAILPDDKPIDDGRVNMTVSFDEAGPQSLTAIDLDDEINISSYTQIVEIGPGAPDAIAIVATDQDLTALENSEIAITVTDDAGNFVADAEVNFAVMSGSGAVSPTTASSDSLGVARTIFTAGQVTETNLVRATVDNLVAEVEVRVTVTPGLPNNTVANYPNPFGINSESTNFDYYLSEDADVTLKIYDLFGNLVWSRHFEAGTLGGLGRDNSVQPNSVEWHGVNDDGQAVGNGGYILVAKAVANRKVIMETKRKIAVIR